VAQFVRDLRLDIAQVNGNEVEAFFYLVNAACKPLTRENLGYKFVLYLQPYDNECRCQYHLIQVVD
jgi:hypothetical protein